MFHVSIAVVKSSENIKKTWSIILFSGIHVSNLYCCHQKMLDDSGENHQKDLIHHSFFREFMFQTSIAIIKKMLDDSGENMKKIWSIVALSDGGQHQPTAGLDQKENKRCWLFFFVGIFIPFPLIFTCALVTPYFGSSLGPPDSSNVTNVAHCSW